MEPNPDCKYCKGTGKIQLLTSTVDCDCITEDSDEKIKIDGESPSEKVVDEYLCMGDDNLLAREWTFTINQDGDVHATVNGVAIDPGVAFSMLPANIVFGNVATGPTLDITYILPVSGCISTLCQ